MASTGKSERQSLDVGLRDLRPMLEQRGFVYTPGAQATSSGGPFAVATFLRGSLEIGLIVRNGNELGCPNYSDGSGYVGHDDLLWALDAADTAHLVPGDFLAYRARDGGDPFEALRADFEQVVLPALDVSEDAFRHALGRALAHLRQSRGW